MFLLIFIKELSVSKAKLSVMMRATKILKYAYGLFFIIAGADKFMNMIVKWERYISPMILNKLPMMSDTFIKIVGAIEMTIGGLILAHCACLGSMLAIGWIGLVIINLLSMGRMYMDVVVRDIMMAVGAYVMGMLAGEKK